MSSFRLVLLTVAAAAAQMSPVEQTESISTETIVPSPQTNTSPMVTSAMTNSPIVTTTAAFETGETDPTVAMTTGLTTIGPILTLPTMGSRIPTAATTTASTELRSSGNITSNITNSSNSISSDSAMNDVASTAPSSSLAALPEWTWIAVGAGGGGLLCLLLTIALAVVFVKRKRRAAANSPSASVDDSDTAMSHASSSVRGPSTSGMYCALPKETEYSSANLDAQQQQQQQQQQQHLQPVQSERFEVGMYKSSDLTQSHDSYNFGNFE